jgi:hypothetical protein
VDFSHSDAEVAGSMIKDVLTVFKIIIAFSIDRESAGRPSFFQVSNWDSVLKNVLKLNSWILTADSHSFTVFSLTVSFAPPRYVMYALDKRDLIGTKANSCSRMWTCFLHLSFSPLSCPNSF